MQLNEFLARVLPSSGHWFVVHIDASGATPTPVSAGDTGAIERLIERGNRTGTNTYYGVCSFVAPPGEALKRNRACAVLGKFRTLRVDIDVGDGKNYQTLEDAEDALYGFIDSALLPDPLLVSSGRGLHVYFPLTQDIPFQQWLVMAERLKAMATQHGLRFDDNICEAERLLRLPTSINQRNGQQAYVMDEGAVSDPEDLLKALVGGELVPYVPPVVGGDELESGLPERTFLPYSAATVIATCPAFNAMAQSGGHDVNEPLWKRTLDLINGGCDSDNDKWELAVEISECHPTYREDALRSKLAQSARQGYPPPTCASVARPECNTCPYRGQVTSPATLGVQTPPAAQSQAVAPVAPLKLAKGVDVTHFDAMSVRELDLGGKYLLCHGFINDRVKDKDEKIKNRCVVRYLRIDSGDLLSNASGSQQTFVLSISTVEKHAVLRTYTVTLDQNDVADNRNLRPALMRQKLSVNPSDISTVLEAIMGFIRHLRNHRDDTPIVSDLGWSDDPEGFCLGDVFVRPDGTVAPHQSPVGPLHNGEPVCSVAGSHALQVEALNSMLVTEQAHLVIALGLVTPLLRFTQFHGAIISMYSKGSGVGKTALLKGVMSIWGSPEHSGIPPLSTPAAMLDLIGKSRAIPAAVDEITSKSPEMINDLLYTISTGQGARRLNRSGALREQQAAWETLLFVTTNKTLASKARAQAIDSDATTARLLELHMPPLPEDIKTGNPDVVLGSNYGHLGRLLVSAMMTAPPSQWEQLIAARRDEVAARLGINAVTGPDRFRAVLAALASIGVTLGRNLGLSLSQEAVDSATARACRIMRVDSDRTRMDNPTVMGEYLRVNQSRMGTVLVGHGSTVYYDGNPKDVSAGERRVLAGRTAPSIIHVPLAELIKFVRSLKMDETDFIAWLDDPSHKTKQVGPYSFFAGLHAAAQYRAAAVSVDPALAGSDHLSSTASIMDFVKSPTVYKPPNKR